MSSLDEFLQNVRQWAADRDIDTQGTRSGQLEKIEEEVEELREANERYLVEQYNPGEPSQETLELMADAVGDTVVTVLCYCETADRLKLHQFDLFDQDVEFMQAWSEALENRVAVTVSEQIMRVEKAVEALRLADEEWDLDIHNSGSPKADTMTRVRGRAWLLIYELVVYCEVTDTDFHDSCWAAWNEIKDRKGRMVNGVFVKETT